MSSLLLEVLPLIASYVMSAIATHYKQSQQDLHDERMYALKATEIARKDTSRATSLSRKFIVHSVIGSLFLFPMLLTLLNWVAPFIHVLMFGDMPWIVFDPVAIYVPKEIMHGGLLSMLWNEEVTEYIPITGFVLMPIHIALAQIICGFYFGSVAMRR